MESAGRSTSDQSARLQELLQRSERLMVSDIPQVERLLQEALGLARELGDTAREAQALMMVGVSYSYRSQFPTALDYLSRAKELAEQVGDAATVARIANNMGISAVALGEYGLGMEHYQDSLSIASSIGDKQGIARALSNIGLIYTELRDHQQALDTYEEVLSLTTGDSQAMQLTHSAATINMIRLLEHLGRMEEAFERARAFLPRVRKLGYLQHEVVLRVWVLPCLIGTGQVELALKEAQDLLPLALQVNDREHVIYVRLFYGEALMTLEKLDEAQEQFELALSDAVSYSVVPLQQKALAHLSQLYALKRHWQQAYELLAECQELEQALRDETLKRKAQVLGVQMQVELVKQEAEAERRRNSELTTANAELQAIQATLAYHATHDSLTGLANRSRFQTEMARTLQTGQTFGLLFLDLDRFKQVNDSLGHEMGDELLREVSKRLLQVVRSGDLVSRMGGDEFTIILNNLGEAQDAELVAHKVLNRLVEPIHVRNHTLHVSASIGVAVGPRDGQDVSTLQKNADIAMYRAKRAGKNGVQAYQPNMGSETAEQVTVERDLRQAIAEGQLALHYQGQFETRGGQLSGFEALVRWQHPERGLLTPGAFIPIAEESGLIIPLGAWVLHEACRQAAAWDANTRGFTVSVNVSALQFEHADFLETVQTALKESGLAPERLIIELTESLLLNDLALARERIEHLKQAGVQLALDDFGKGYSSLNLLQDLPVDILKIDSSFVKGKPVNSDRARGLLAFLISLSHHLQMRVTAEGVETEDQYTVLRDLGCDAIQGYYLGRPEPVDVAEDHLRTALKTPAEE